jgi:hypothetical protein
LQRCPAGGVELACKDGLDGNVQESNSSERSQQQLSKLYQSYIWANIHYPQVGTGLSLAILGTFLAESLTLEDLVAPMSEAELQASAEAMNRVHEAYGVQVRTDIRGKDIRNISKTRLQDLYWHMKSDALAVFDELISNYPEFNDLKTIGPGAYRVKIVQIFMNSPKYTENRSRLKKLGAQILHFLHQDALLELAKAHRLKIKSTLTASSDSPKRDKELNEIRTSFPNQLLDELSLFLREHDQDPEAANLKKIFERRHRFYKKALGP